MNQQDQNLPAEYIPVVSMIQKEDSIRKGVESLKEKILVSAGEEFLSWSEEKQNQFLERTIITIAKDPKLADCFTSPEGKLSIIEAIEKTVSTGLLIGGKHAYLVPQPKKTNRVDQKGNPIWVTEIRFQSGTEVTMPCYVVGKNLSFLIFAGDLSMKKTPALLTKETAK